MALGKEIMQPNGITLGYHRISRVLLTANVRNSIYVESYIDQAAREAEINGELRPYKVQREFASPYNPAMSVPLAYDFIKALPVFEGAEDLMDEAEPDEVTGDEFISMIEGVL